MEVGEGHWELGTGQVGSQGVEEPSEDWQVAGDAWIRGVQVDRDKGKGQAGWGV